MLLTFLAPSLAQAPKPAREFPVAAPTAISHFFVLAFIALLAVGLVLAILLIVRSALGKPYDSSDSVKSSKPVTPPRSGAI